MDDFDRAVHKVHKAKLLPSLRVYFKVALLGAMTMALLATALTGIVLDVVLVAIAIGFLFLFCKI